MKTMHLPTSSPGAAWIVNKCMALFSRMNVATGSNVSDIVLIYETNIECYANFYSTPIMISWLQAAWALGNAFPNKSGSLQCRRFRSNWRRWHWRRLLWRNDQVAADSYNFVAGDICTNVDWSVCTPALKIKYVNPRIP